MPDISIIIVSWNAKQYLLDCLQSIRDCRIQNSVEIIVVDNASSDGSPAAAAERFPEVKLIRNPENCGFSKANNIGIRQAGGRYLALVNSDVVILPQCLDRLTAFMDQHPTIGLCGPKILNPDRTLQISAKPFPTLWTTFCSALAIHSPGHQTGDNYYTQKWQDGSVLETETLIGCFWFARREAVNQVGVLDERYFIYGEDMDWSKRFNAAGWKVVIYLPAEAIHCRGKSSANQPVRFYLEMQKANIQYFTKHHSWWYKNAYQAVVFFHQWIRLIGYAFGYWVQKSKRNDALLKMKRSYACIRWFLTGRYPTNL